MNKLEELLAALFDLVVWSVAGFVLPILIFYCRWLSILTGFGAVMSLLLNGFVSQTVLFVAAFLVHRVAMELLMRLLVRLAPEGTTYIF